MNHFENAADDFYCTNATIEQESCDDDSGMFTVAVDGLNGYYIVAAHVVWRIGSYDFEGAFSEVRAAWLRVEVESGCQFWEASACVKDLELMSPDDSASTIRKASNTEDLMVTGDWLGIGEHSLCLSVGRPELLTMKSGGLVLRFLAEAFGDTICFRVDETILYVDAVPAVEPFSLSYFAEFQNCFGQSSGALLQECLWFDFDRNGDVYLEDFEVMLSE